MPCGSLIKAVAKVFMLTFVNSKIMENFVSNNIICPFNFLLLRPHQRYEMGMAIKTKPGSETGNTFWNKQQDDYQEEDHVYTKTRFGSFTWEAKPIITNPTKVFLIWDIFCFGTLGGAGVDFYTAEDKGSNYLPDQKLFPDKDIFAAILPYEERSFPNPLSISGGFGHVDITGFVDRAKNGHDAEHRVLHYSTAAFYDLYWQWISLGDRSNPLYEQNYHPHSYGKVSSNLEPKNVVCWRMLTWHMDTIGGGPGDNGKWQLRTGTGHFGNHAYPGCLAGRQGTLGVPWEVPAYITNATA